MKKKNTARAAEAEPRKAAASSGGGRWRHASVPRRYRVELINENTLSQVWSLRFVGVRAILAGIAAVAAVASLVAVIFMFTPLGRFLPGHLKGDLRARYTDMALHVDSLERIVREQRDYTANIVAIFSDSLPERPLQDVRQPSKAAVVDSLISAGDAEQRFVKQFEEEQRFNLSVLSPIAAEGMIFETPSEGESGIGAVSSVYRGTVVAVFTDTDGRSSIVVQHPGDFISVYGDVAETYVDRGDKVVAGQRIGNASPGRPLQFELWHGGTRLDPSIYIPQ